MGKEALIRRLSPQRNCPFLQPGGHSIKRGGETVKVPPAAWKAGARRAVASLEAPGRVQQRVHPAEEEQVSTHPGGSVHAVAFRETFFPSRRDGREEWRLGERAPDPSLVVRVVDHDPAMAVQQGEHPARRHPGASGELVEPAEIQQREGDLFYSAETSRRLSSGILLIFPVFSGAVFLWLDSSRAARRRRRTAPTRRSVRNPRGHDRPGPILREYGSPRHRGPSRRMRDGLRSHRPRPFAPPPGSPLSRPSSGPSAADPLLRFFSLISVPPHRIIVAGLPGGTCPHALLPITGFDLDLLALARSVFGMATVSTPLSKCAWMRSYSTSRGRTKERLNLP
jgi:hypothetical protein